MASYPAEIFPLSRFTVRLLWSSVLSLPSFKYRETWLEEGSRWSQDTWTSRLTRLGSRCLKLLLFYFHLCLPVLRGRPTYPPLPKCGIVSPFFDSLSKNSYRKLFSRCFVVWTSGREKKESSGLWVGSSIFGLTFPPIEGLCRQESGEGIQRLDRSICFCLAFSLPPHPSLLIHCKTELLLMAWGGEAYSLGTTWKLLSH